MYEMKDSYYTGIEMIDEGHKKLLQIITSAYHIDDSTDIKNKYDACCMVLKELKEYSIQYFSEEEDYLEDIKYEWIVQHKLKHQVFVEKIEEFELNEKDSSPKNKLLDFFTYLTGCMIEHILNMDKLITKS